MNKVFLNGYLAADPKQRITSKGFEQSLFSIGVTDISNFNQSYFFPCVAWNNQAKFINSNLKKGSFVSIDGRLTRRSYVDNEGKNIYVTEIVVDNLKTYGNTRSTTSTSNSTTTNSAQVSNDTNDTITIIDEVINNNKNKSEELTQITENSSESEKTFDWDWDLD